MRSTTLIITTSQRDYSKTPKSNGNPPLRAASPPTPESDHRLRDVNGRKLTQDDEVAPSEAL